MPKFKAIPWLIVLELAMIAREHWGKLPDKDRRELARIVKKSHGRPANLTASEKQDLKRLVSMLDLPGAGRRAVPLGTRLRRRH